MTVQTAFVSKANVALAEDCAILSLGSPSGPLIDGKIVTQETMRLVMSHATLREFAAVLAQRVAELEKRQAQATAEQAAKQLAAAMERRSLRGDDDDDIGPITNLQ